MKNRPRLLHARPLLAATLLGAATLGGAGCQPTGTIISNPLFDMAQQDAAPPRGDIGNPLFGQDLSPPPDMAPPVDAKNSD